jgi:hypothetical protein
VGPLRVLGVLVLLLLVLGVVALVAVLALLVAVLLPALAPVLVPVPAPILAPDPARRPAQHLPATMDTIPMARPDGREIPAPETSPTAIPATEDRRPVNQRNEAR